MQNKYTEVYFSLGSNLGNRKQNLNRAVEELEKRAGMVFARSSFYETVPWGFESEHLFLNIAVGLKTELSPFGLLEESKKIECEMGRVPSPEEKYEDRPIDIDLLFYGDKEITSPLLEIPHPRLHLRDFVLEPLNEIAPQFLHPKLKKTIEEIRKQYIKADKL